MLLELFVATMTLNLKTLVSKPFVVTSVSNISFLLPMWLVRMVCLRGKIVRVVRSHGRCLMSIGL
jgi:acyl-CoA hydrolase